MKEFIEGQKFAFIQYINKKQEEYDTINNNALNQNQTTDFGNSIKEQAENQKKSFLNYFNEKQQEFSNFVEEKELDYERFCEEKEKSLKESLEAFLEEKKKDFEKYFEEKLNNPYEKVKKEGDFLGLKRRIDNQSEKNNN